MKRISELLPEKINIMDKRFGVGTSTRNEIIDQVTKALDAIDPTKIRFKAKKYWSEEYTEGFYFKKWTRDCCGGTSIKHYITEFSSGETHRISLSTLSIFVEG